MMTTSNPDGCSDLQVSWHGGEAHSGPIAVEDTDGPEQLLDAYLEAASGAISRNTERALRADAYVFTAWCHMGCPG